MNIAHQKMQLENLDLIDEVKSEVANAWNSKPEIKDKISAVMDLVESNFAALENRPFNQNEESDSDYQKLVERVRLLVASVDSQMHSTDPLKPWDQEYPSVYQRLSEIRTKTEEAIKKFKESDDIGMAA